MTDLERVLTELAVVASRLDSVDRQMGELRADLAIHKSHQDDDITANKKKSTRSSVNLMSFVSQLPS